MASLRAAINTNRGTRFLGTIVTCPCTLRPDPNALPLQYSAAPTVDPFVKLGTFHSSTMRASLVELDAVSCARRASWSAKGALDCEFPRDGAPHCNEAASGSIGGGDGAGGTERPSTPGALEGTCRLSHRQEGRGLEGPSRGCGGGCCWPYPWPPPGVQVEANRRPK
jgi:hypothetical protein